MTLGELWTRMSSEELTLQWAYDNVLVEERKLHELNQRAQQNLKKRRG